MSKERVTSCTEIVEEDTDTDGQHNSTGCFKVSALCCCIPKRRLHLPGRRPRDRKKKNEKKSSGDISFGDTVLEGRQKLGQDYRSMTSSGDVGDITNEGVKPALKVCIQTNDKRNQDPHIPVKAITLADICLEEKKQEHTETTNAKALCIQGTAWQQKEGIKNVSFLSTETEKRCLVGDGSEGMPFTKGKDSLVVLAKEKRQSSRPELLSSLLQGAINKKEQQQGRDHVSTILEGVPCKQGLKQGHKSMPFQKLQQSIELDIHTKLLTNDSRFQEEQNSSTCPEQELYPCKQELKHGHETVLFQELQQSMELELHNTLATSENKFKEAQNSSTDAESVSTLQELLNQSSALRNEEQEALGPQNVITGVPHNTKGPTDWNQMNSVSKGDDHKEDKDCQDKFSGEKEQPTELKYPDILSTMCGKYEQEQLGVQQQQDFNTENPSNKTENHNLALLYHEDQPPVVPKIVRFSFQGAGGEKKQKETQAMKNSTSDTVLTKTEGHHYVPHQAAVQAAARENPDTLSLDVTYTRDLQKRAYMDTLPEDAAVHIIEQKHHETPQLLLLEQVSTHHEEKEQQEALACAYSGPKFITYIEEQKSQEPIVSQDTSIFLDKVSHETESPRKLECGNSGPEDLYDKRDQNKQDPVYLEMKQPLLFAKLGSLPLTVIPEEVPCISNDYINVGKLEIQPLDEEPKEQDDQHKMHTVSCSTEKATIQELEEQQSTLPAQAGCSTEEEQRESWLSQKTTSIPNEVQQEREQLNRGVTSEKYQKEKQDLSNTTFPGSTREDEGHV